MRAVFADTFFWIATTNPADSGHAAAARLDRELDGVAFVTTADVLDEFLAFFAESPLRSRALETVDDIFAEPGVLVVPQSDESFRRGLDLYRARPDKGYSLTDCISMNVMRDFGIHDVLTRDNHFTQEGFRALLA